MGSKVTIKVNSYSYLLATKDYFQFNVVFPTKDRLTPCVGGIIITLGLPRDLNSKQVIAINSLKMG